MNESQEPQSETPDERLLPAALGSANRLGKAVNGLMEIVEGVLNVRWSHEGRRLVDTPEWCELYCAWNETKRTVIAADQPEAICDDCGGANVVWFTPSELWNKVVRRRDQSDPMLCPRCFILRAEAMGIKLVWQIAPESPNIYVSFKMDALLAVIRSK